MVLHGQDGYSADQARGFPATPQPPVRAVRTGRHVPICATGPGGAPRAMDVITPAGLDQSTELDPTTGPVTIHGVSVP